MPSSVWTGWYKSEKPGWYVWMAILNSSADMGEFLITMGKSLAMTWSSILVQGV